MHSLRLPLLPRIPRPNFTPLDRMKNYLSKKHIYFKHQDHRNYKLDETERD